MIEVKTEIKKYLKYCSLEKKLSKHTLKAYRIDLAQFIAFKPDISISKDNKAENRHAKSIRPLSILQGYNRI